ncbi:MAG: 50S ribosomal protein L22 [Candidatus Methanofastidiosia archaeon]
MGYSLTVDETKTAKVFGRELRISSKHCVEILREIKGKRCERAKEYLEDVVDKKRAVPFRKHNIKVGHKKLLKWDAGRYPVKASKAILKLIDEVETNAEYKGLDRARLRILHTSAYKGRCFKSFIPRAYGRATPYNHETVNIEIVVEEI